MNTLTRLVLCVIGIVVSACSQDGLTGEQWEELASPAIRVNAGASTSYTDAQGQVWSADSSFTGGTAYSNTQTVQNTTDPTLYKTERYSTTGFSYAFSVNNGSYVVTLKFAETFTAITAAGQRKFNVKLNGQQVLSQFDIFAAAGNRRDWAVDRQFPVDVTNGQIKIDFAPTSPQVENPKVNAIEIRPAASALPDLVIDPSSITWAPANPKVGDAVRFSATVRNTGSAVPSGSAIRLGFYVDDVGTSWTTQHTTGLATNATATLTAIGTYAVTSSGTKKVMAFADDLTTISESNETNNTSTQDMIVGTTTAPPTDTFVSTLVPTNNPPFNGWGPYELDESNGENAAGDGRILTLNGATYQKGIGVAPGVGSSNSVLTYSLASGTTYGRFQADVGVDEEVGNAGSVAFKVFLATGSPPVFDNVPAFESPVMTGASSALPINISVAGKTALKLVVTDGGDGINFDHADWANARLTPYVAPSGTTCTLTGGSAGSPAALGSVVNSGSCTTYLLGDGYYQSSTLTRANVTIRALHAHKAQVLKPLNLSANGLTVEGIHVDVANSGAGISIYNQGVSVVGAYINNFAKPNGTASNYGIGLLINDSAIGPGYAVTTVRDSRFDDWGGSGGNTTYVGSAALIVGSTPTAFKTSSIAANILNNTFTNGPLQAKAGESSIQMFEPAYVFQNRIDRQDGPGIQNKTVNSTIKCNVLSRLSGDNGALYNRRAGGNLWEYNLVTASTMGFEHYTGDLDIFRNNVFHNVQYFGRVKNHDAGSTNLTITNNTFNNNNNAGATGSWALIWDATWPNGPLSNVVYSNNVFRSVSYNVIGDPVANYPLVYGSAWKLVDNVFHNAALPAQHTNSIVADPMLANVALFDFTVLSTQPGVAGKGAIWPFPCQ